MCYPLPYERDIWHYQRANVDQIQRAIEQFSREKLFRDLNINEMVSLFNRTIIKNFFKIMFLTKQSLAMTKIHLSLITTSSS